MKGSSSRQTFGHVYCAAFLFALFGAFTVYINSDFLGQFFTAQGVTYLYTAAAIETLIALIAVPQLIRKYGVFKLTIAGLFLEMACLFGLATSTNLMALAAFFIIQQSLPFLLLFFLDVFLEGSITSERITGRIRSNYFTMMNLAYLLSPALVGKIISVSSYRSVYMFAYVFSIALFVLITLKFRFKKTHSFREIDFGDSIRKFHFREGLVTVFALNFLLQCFYCVMVIYTQPYLLHTIGFDWSKLGVMLTIMLVPFVLFEAPLGRLFDKFHHEQNAIMAGFFLMGLTTILIFCTHTQSFLIWATLLFFSRVGASFVEMGTEYSFFKRVNDRDAGFISVFRMTMPLAYIIAPLATGALLLFVETRFVFLAVSIAMLVGLFTSLSLNRLPKKTST